MEQLRFKNLAKSKAYRDSVAIWGEPTKAIRKRVIIAPSFIDCENEVTRIKTAGPKQDKPDIQPTIDETKLTSYRNWIAQRKTLRKEFEKCTADTFDDIMSSKVRVTETDSNYNVSHPASGPDQLTARPSIQQPLPRIMLGRIHKFLQGKKLRMYDLFVQADRDKDWKITSKEFQTVLRKAGMEFNDDQIEQLVSALDENFDDVLEYKELVHGLQSFLQDERGKLSQPLPELPQLPAELRVQTDDVDEITRKTSSFLLIPKSKRTDVMANADEEKRLKKEKRKEKHRRKVKTTPEIPEQACTMGGGTGAFVTRFQDQRRREFEKVLELCHLHGVKLSKNTLERVLLHPVDKPEIECISSLTPSTSRNLREQKLSLRPGSGKQRPSLNDQSSEISRVRKSTYLRNVYPLASAVRPRKERVELSCGSADISRKTDCWMTYEEYHVITRHVYSRFEKTWRPISAADQWPSYVENKVRLYLDKPGAKVRSENTIFNIVNNKTIH